MTRKCPKKPGKMSTNRLKKCLQMKLSEKSVVEMSRKDSKFFESKMSRNITGRTRKAALTEYDA